MANFDILEDLKWRGAINQETDEEGLRHYLAKHDDLALYCGTDPTGDSLHIGHLIPFMVLKRFQLAGYKPVIVIGGGTGSIGDPSGRSTERVLQSEETIKHNEEALTAQMVKLFGTENFRIVNNRDWLGKMTLLEFLRDYGKLFQVNNMLNKEVVASRLENGISFTEFSYQILQAIDFYILNRDHGVQMQIGGADQWGNITAGIDLIHRLEGADRPAFGLTIPLMLKADGTKFGKSAGGAVWLDPEKTSPYEFYQFWINQDDRDVIKYLKYFTFLNHEEIDALEEKVKTEPWKREAQKRLAEEVTKFVHGEEGLKEAQTVTEALFSGNVKDLTTKQVEIALAKAPSAESGAEKKNLVDFLVDTKIESSKRQAREDVNNGAIYVNGDRIQDTDFEVDPAAAFDGKFVIIRKGKKKYTLVHIKG
ncbi:tyrosine--tRNA ligase [Lactobacillus delbrueckii]|uniref:tyrosine--tRNA ligase n=1 Tax=Lactobacillus delbrueckii TaxID=1584 RepID=UPI00047061AE|nr:tyrosine--tRNA ligase [Lactobacillus delbrueckii]APP10609.1 tyrosine--tRNA ligase [Lactobacillus delbrueckii subsp. delbrueckii DSM 20074 = JCM 1012]KNZ38715.1 tyrosine--tRNA ligase [Lactobacillus delbrueckii subsp. delbrueckii]MCT3493225.1 tyrosine--tRNA ligase [Lactobacillus delbrueckii]MCT3521438.1 tyrosine--tRNA ligase [Lactobacillus delbrueckii]